VSALLDAAARPGDRPPLDEQNPWPALDSFHEADRKFFRGRAEVTNEVLRLVLRERVTVLYGVSGIGKSSLLEAGLFPLLRQQGALPISIRFDFSSDDPDLTGQVKRAISAQAEAGGVEAPAHAELETLWEYLHRREQSFWDDRNRLVMPVLVFDQFEELFTLGAERPEKQARARELLVQLADLAEGRAPQDLAEWLEEHPESATNFTFDSHQYRILIGVREDYLAYLEDLRDLMPGIVLNRKRLWAMDGAAALEVVSQAQRLISPEVAEQVVRFVARAGSAAKLADMVVEPALLSVMCSELNEKRRSRAEEQISAGLLQGSKDEILRDFYERATGDVSASTRKFIEEQLILDPGYRDTVALEAALKRPGVTEGDVGRLVKRRLVRVEERGGVRRIELTHDLLIGVIRESRDKRHLTEKAEEEKTAREIAEQRERAARKTLRRTRALAAVFILLAVAAVVMAGWALVATKAARRAQQETLVTLARSQVQQGETMHEQGDEDNLALAYFARAIRVDPAFGTPKPWIASLLLQGRLSRMVFPHTDAVNAAAFSPDGKLVVTACDDDAGQVWDAATGAPVGLPLQHADAVVAATFSPDGKWVLTGSMDGTAQVWDAATSKPVGARMHHEFQVYLAVFSRDGKRVLTASHDQTARVWDAATGEPVGPPIMDNGALAAFSPDGKWVAALSAANAARVWNAETGQPVSPPVTHAGFINDMAFSPDGEWVVTASMDNTARVWEAATGKTVGLPLRHNDSVYSAAFNSNGKWVVTASGDKTARIWEAATGDPVGPPMRHAQMVATAVFSPDGKQILTRTKPDYNVVKTWEAGTGIELGLAVQEEDSINSAEFSPDGRWIVTASKDKTARVWPAFASRAVGLELPHKDKAPPVLSPDSRWVVTAPGDSTARIWETATGKSAGLAMPLSAPLQSAAFSRDGQRIVTADASGSVRVWEAPAGKAMGTPMRPGAIVKSVAFSPDGRQVVTASKDRAQVWDVETGNAVGRPLKHEDNVNSAVFSPDGAWVLTASDDKTARVWEVRTGKAVAPAMRHENAVYSAEFSPNGEQVLTASADATARTWHAKTGRQIAAMQHDGAVESATFSPNGQFVLTVSQHNVAQIWNAENGRPVGLPLPQGGDVATAEFSPDGNWVVIASANNLAQVAEAATGKPAGLPLLHKSAVTAAKFSPDGKWIVTSSSESARVWPAYTAIQGAGALAELAEVVSGYQITDLGTIGPARNIPARFLKLQQMASSAHFGDLSTTSLIKWYFATPQERSIAPGLTLPVCDYIGELVRQGRLADVASGFPAQALFCESSK
jgi:WD40 repeat protein